MVLIHSGKVLVGQEEGLGKRVEVEIMGQDRMEAVEENMARLW